MKHHGIGVGYRYPHDFEGHDVDQQSLTGAPHVTAVHQYSLQ
jgi:replication-associated recombination protein RarA